MLIIEVTGVKGGAGRSTISALLALSMAKKGTDVILLDLDPLGWSSYLMEVRERDYFHPYCQVTRGPMD